MPKDVGNLLLVGHNPDIATLARQLVGEGPAADWQALHQGFPTAALAVIDCEAAAWADLSLARGRLQAFVTPAQLGGGLD
jgi:phosphohistidine phosphatase